MTPLFKIPLGGAGTVDTESFASYLYRMSFEHGLSVGEMLKHLYRNAGEVVAREIKLPKRPYGINPSFWARPSRATRSYVRMAEIMTGLDLTPGTLWFMDKPDGRSRNEIVWGFRWCPECLQEMQQVCQEPYFKLVWHLSEISHCPHHRTPFMRCCGSCGNDQTTYRRNRPIHLCQECGAELSMRSHALLPENIACSWMETGSDIVQLLDDLSGRETYCLPDDGIIQSLNQLYYFYMVMGRKEEFAGMFDVEKVIDIIEKRRMVSLKLARRFAYRLGVSLYTLLNGDVLQGSEVLTSSWVCTLPPGFASIDHKVSHDHERVLADLKKILASRKPCPSKKRLAATLGVSIGYLEYRFPALTAEIVAKHAELVEQSRLERRLKARHAALTYFVSSTYTDLPKSRKQAYKVLRQETGLPKFMLKDAIAGVHQALNAVSAR